MVTEPTTVDLARLAAFVDAAERQRLDLAERHGRLDELRRRVSALSPDFGVERSSIERFGRFIVDLHLTESFAETVRQSVLDADRLPGNPWLDEQILAGRIHHNDRSLLGELEANLVRDGIDPALAAAMAIGAGRLLAGDRSTTLDNALEQAAANHLGLSVEEFRQRRRALELSRQEAVGLVADAYDRIERQGGTASGITHLDLMAAATDRTLSDPVRDAAYRLALDGRLFDDLDATHRTTALGPVGFDRGETDGVLGRSDFEQFALKDYQIQTLLPWRILIDSAADGYDVSKANGSIRPQGIDSFLRDVAVPANVRQALWDFYVENDPLFVESIEPFSATDDERDSPAYREAVARGLVGAPAAGLLRGPVFTGQARGQTRGSRGTGRMGTLVAAVIVSVLVDPVVDRGVEAYHRHRAPGTTGIRITDAAGQPIEIPIDAIAAYPADRLPDVIRWLAATGEPPDEVQLDQVPPDSTYGPRGWVDVWSGQDVAVRHHGLPDLDDEDIESDPAATGSSGPSGKRPDLQAYPEGPGQQAIELENYSADRWCEDGHDVEFINDGASAPPLNSRGETPPRPTRKPDHLVDGEFRDAYSPTSSTVRNVVRDGLDKVKRGQTQRVDIVVDSGRTDVTVDQIIACFNEIAEPIIDWYTYRGSNGVFPVLEVTILDHSTGERVTIFERPETE